jgi:large subunit ribosomal protein L23
MKNIIVKPLITEKMTAEAENNQRYGFVVDRKANKIQIKEAVEKLYGVSVTKVWTMNYAGKNRSRFTKTGAISGKTSAIKKALVSLSDGETIDFYSNI